MTQKWNLQDIRPAEPRRRRPSNFDEVNSVSNNHSNHTHTASESVERGNYDDGADTIVIKNGNKESRFNIALISGVVALIVIGIFAVSALLSKTTLTVYPEFNEPTVNAEYTAYPDRRADALSYEIMTLSEEGERQVKATGQETVKTQAKGYIEIIKSTPGTERLIKNTRFRAPSGQIFRIQESVVVPGAVKDASGSLIPGTIRAEVFADEAGQEFNLPAGTKFDVPGFKESNLTELYNSIYAENREAFTGGFNGPKFIIDEDELATAKQTLQIELRDKLLKRIEAEKPADFAAFPGAVAITYNSQPTIQFGDNLVTIREQAVLQLPLFKNDDFAKFLALETIPTYEREEVRITNLSDLTFAYKDQNTSSINIADQTSLTFKILGKPQIVSSFDAVQLKKDLAGKPLTAISFVLTGHKGIKSAKISGKPFWKRSFPDDPEDITVIEVIGKDE
ncbi:MAG: hypothetical protein R3B53_04000 [Candidatus Paceibacterota bacterium]